jgi:hypothetical protein
MSIDGIAMQAAPRRHIHAGNNGTRSLLNQYFTKNQLHFYSNSAIPRTERQGLYAKAFREAVDKAAGSEIKVAQLKTQPYELCISALNTRTGREIRLYASIFVGLPEMPEYSAAVYKLDGESSQLMNTLKANSLKKLMAQYKNLRDRLYNHIRTPDST